MYYAACVELLRERARHSQLLGSRRNCTDPPRSWHTHAYNTPTRPHAHTLNTRPHTPNATHAPQRANRLRASRRPSNLIHLTPQTQQTTQCRGHRQPGRPPLKTALASARRSGQPYQRTTRLDRADCRVKPKTFPTSLPSENHQQPWTVHVRIFLCSSVLFLSSPSPNTRQPAHREGITNAKHKHKGHSIFLLIKKKKRREEERNKDTKEERKKKLNHIPTYLIPRKAKKKNKNKKTYQEPAKRKGTKPSQLISSLPSSL